MLIVLVFYHLRQSVCAIICQVCVSIFIESIFPGNHWVHNLFSMNCPVLVFLLACRTRSFPCTRFTSRTFHDAFGFASFSRELYHRIQGTFHIFSSARFVFHSLEVNRSLTFYFQKDVFSQRPFSVPLWDACFCFNIRGSSVVYAIL